MIDRHRHPVIWRTVALWFAMLFTTFAIAYAINVISAVAQR